MFAFMAVTDVFKPGILLIEKSFAQNIVLYFLAELDHSNKKKLPNFSENPSLNKKKVSFFDKYIEK